MYIELASLSLKHGLAEAGSDPWRGVPQEIRSRIEKAAGTKHPDALLRIRIMAAWCLEVVPEVRAAAKKRIAGATGGAGPDAETSAWVDQVAEHLVPRQFSDGWIREKSSTTDRRIVLPPAPVERKNFAIKWREDFVAGMERTVVELVAGLRLLAAFPVNGTPPATPETPATLASDPWESRIRKAKRLRFLPPQLRKSVRERIESIAGIAASRCHRKRTWRDQEDAEVVGKRAGHAVIALFNEVRNFADWQAYVWGPFRRKAFVLREVRQDLKAFRALEASYPRLLRRTSKIQDHRFTRTEIADEAGGILLKKLNSGGRFRHPDGEYRIPTKKASKWAYARLIERWNGELPVDELDGESAAANGLPDRPVPLDVPGRVDVLQRIREGVLNLERNSWGDALRQIARDERSPAAGVAGPDRRRMAKKARKYLKENDHWPALIASIPCALPRADGTYPPDAPVGPGSQEDALRTIDDQSRRAFVLQILEKRCARRVADDLRTTINNVGVMVNRVGTCLLEAWAKAHGGPEWRDVTF